jgi:hypothetical protein
MQAACAYLVAPRCLHLAAELQALPAAGLGPAGRRSRPRAPVAEETGRAPAAQRQA